MADPMTFEARLANAYERYVAVAPVEVDAVEVARMAVQAAPRQRSLLDRLVHPAWLARAPRRTLVLATVAMLLLAFGVALLVGALLNQPPRPGGDHLVLTNGPVDCQDAIRIDVRTGEQAPIVDCAKRLRIAPGGTRAAASGSTGITIIDLADGTSEPMASAPGPFTIPAAWSPTGHLLHWVSCDANTEGCQGFIGQPGSSATNPIPEPESGFNGSFEWADGDTAFLLAQDEGVLVGAGDGGGLAPHPAWTQLPMAVAPDGLTAAVTEGRQLSGGELARSDVFLEPIAGGPGTGITDNPDGWFVACAAWSPDGTIIATTVIHRGTSAAPEPEPVAELHLVTPDGTLQDRWPLPVATGLDCDVLLGRSAGITWAPDGERILFKPNQSDENPPPDPFVVTVATGEILPLAGLQRPEFSPDGASIAALGNVDSSNPDATDAPATLVIVDLESGNPRSLGSVTIAPWTVLVWAP